MVAKTTKVRLDVLENASENLKLISLTFQKGIVLVAFLETTKTIINDFRDELFFIIVDESKDISNKEKIAIVFSYVNKYGSIVERFLGISHVKTTTSISLKMTIDDLLCKNGLTTSRISGQGYDGPSNMQGELFWS